MNGNPFVRLENACANAIERAFALAFPSALEPVQIARKLVAAFEAAGSAPARAGRRFIVRLHPSDYARLRSELPYLERQWSAMLARLAERSRKAQRPTEVAALGDAAVAAGTVAIASEPLAEPRTLVLRARKGVAREASVPLERAVVVGRDAACDFVLADPRVSRRHVAIAVEGGLHFTDLDSSNGTFLNGARVTSGALAYGDVLGLGDSELIVAAEPALAGR